MKLVLIDDEGEQHIIFANLELSDLYDSMMMCAVISDLKDLVNSLAPEDV